MFVLLLQNSPKVATRQPLARMTNPIVCSWVPTASPSIQIPKAVEFGPGAGAGELPPEPAHSCAKTTPQIWRNYSTNDAE